MASQPFLAVNDEEEKKGMSCAGKSAIALLLTAGVTVGIMAALGLFNNSTPDSPLLCRGFNESNCPVFPQPYPGPGTYPTSYAYTGKFPENFIWGLGTASYQVEGAYNEGGRGVSIWDTFSGVNTVGMVGSVCSEAPCAVNPQMFAVGATGAVAVDQYHKFKEDALLMSKLGVKYYRFSIAWPRVVPTGNIADGINEQGLAYYDALIEALLAVNVIPAVTLYHWDLPQALLNSANGTYGWYGVDADGHPNGLENTGKHFLDFADLCFSRYGNRVKTWITFNEAWTFLWLGSGGGKAPGTAEYMDNKKWPYIGAHNVLLTHAATVQLYKSKYAQQKGIIGMTNNVDWREPKTTRTQDIAAAARALEFWIGWFADPLYFGQYPASMVELVGEHLPRWTVNESSLLLNNKPDFFGLNHYGTAFVTDSDSAGANFAYGTSDFGELPQAQSTWLYGAGWGFRKLLNYVHNRYHPDGGIIVTENGWSVAADTPEEGMVDPGRTLFYANYTSEMLRAIHEDGVDVRGYFAWSLCDNYEWERGYTERFGVVYTDYGFGFDPNSPSHQDKQPTVNQSRYVKDSGCWLSAVWSNNTLIDPATFNCTIPRQMPW